MGKKCLMKNNILKIIIPVCIAIIAISIISLNSIGTSSEENNFSTDHFVSKTITVGEFPIGISVNPIVTLDGGSEINMVYLENVKVPLKNIIHEENKAGRSWSWPRASVDRLDQSSRRVELSVRNVPSRSRQGRG